MTLTEATDYLRRRFNETSSTTSYWSDSELWDLILSREQEACIVIGPIEATNTSTTTVASTQAYTLPSGVIGLKAVLYDGQLLQPIDFKDWEVDKASGGTTPEGTPVSYVRWDDQVILIPTPDAAETLTYYYEAEPGAIDDATDTIDLPAILHRKLMDGVLADMFSKAQNQGMAQYYEQRWEKHLSLTFPRYKWAVKRRSANRVVTDADTALGTVHGIR